MKLPLFIASSKESTAVADAINRNLDAFAEVTVWKNWEFPSLESTLAGLRTALENHYFGIFVATPDDLSTIRGQELRVARDNVIFELGLFIGRYGSTHCFVVCPRGEGIHLPSDILGATVSFYDGERFKRAQEAAMNPVTSGIKNAMQKQAVAERLAAGLYFGPEHKNFSTPDWRTYSGKPIPVEVQADGSISFPGTTEEGWRHPADRDSLRAPGRTFAFRIRAETEVRIYPVIELADGKRQIVKINTHYPNWGVPAGGDEYRVPLPPDFPSHWKVVVVDLESVASDLGTSVLRLTGLRVRGGLTISHIWCLHSFEELPSQFQKDVTIIQAVGSLQPLEAKIRELCRGLKAFLREQGPEPSAEVMAWRLKFQGGYKSRFAERVERVRDEVKAQAGIRDGYLDNAISTAANSPNGEVKAVEDIAEKLWNLALRLVE
jgi:predicted nucleotide-binding protein with TIR-like domain